MKNSIISVILSLFLCSISYSGTIDPDISDNQYIKYGEKFNCVVKICGMYNDGSSYCASAVVIKPNYILTAAHVVKNSKRCEISVGDKKYKISKVIPHKNFDPDNFGLYDIAIGYSEEKIDIGTQYPALYEDRNEKEKQCDLSGYGLHGTFVTGAISSDNKRRAGSNSIDYIERHMLVCSVSRSTDRNKTPLEFITASGDSGGGLFINDKLAGIHSCIMTYKKAPNSDYSTESGHTRVSQYIDWIESNTK